MNRWLSVRHLLMLVCLLGTTLHAQIPDSTLVRLVTQSTVIINGFERTLSGNTIDYPSINEYARSALLARATDGTQAAEWVTDPVPATSRAKEVTFVWLAALSGSKGVNRFDLEVNGQPLLSFRTHGDEKVLSWSVSGEKGSSLTFCATQMDRFRDLAGYMFLRAPAALLQKGQPLRIRVTGEAGGSQAWYMTFQYPLRASVRVRALPALVAARDTVCQPVHVEIEHYGPPRQVVVGTDSSNTTAHTLVWGMSAVTVPVKAAATEQRATVTMKEKGKLVYETPVRLLPVTRREIYLLAHSHTDIGYSAHQEKVERDHIRFIDSALNLIDRTRNFPAGAQFKWNIEVAWELDRYLAQTTPAQHKRLLQAIREGRVGINALYTNVLTGIQRPEEQLHNTSFARAFARATEVPLTSAMITDIPSYSWSMVTALSLAGVRYLSSGPNYVPQLPDGGDRIGGMLKAWGDRPFYWTSSNNEHKVLFWMAGRGYSWFHGWIQGHLHPDRPTQIFRYMEELDSIRYPYTMVQVRYTIDADNGPPDPELGESVRRWNERYLAPRIIIATTAEMFAEFEKRYGQTLPVLAGDLTPYWEDGAASTARELGMNRRAAERLVQAEVLHAMREPAAFPSEAIADAWRSILLFSEHTWGASNSVTEPDSAPVKAQWDHKKGFVDRAVRNVDDLVAAGANLPTGDTPVAALEVVNTTSWGRSDLVKIPAGVRLAGEQVSDDRGSPLPSQRLSTGELAILVKDVPPLGSLRLRFSDGGPHKPAGGLVVRTGVLENDELAVDVDAKTGALQSVLWKKQNVNMVDPDVWGGFNAYLYVPGKDPRTVVRDSGVSVAVQEQGPLIASLVVTSSPAGANAVRREITVVNGLPRCDVRTLIDKKSVRLKESVHLAFPFHVPDGVVRLDLGWETLVPERDQLAGSCKDYFCVQRWADVSNSTFGMTLAVAEAPLLEVGELTDETPVPGGTRGWRKQIPDSQTLFSYVMNNYWHTNYKADQEGTSAFSFSIVPHGPFDRTAATRLGIEHSQPLIIRSVADRQPQAGIPFVLVPSPVMVTMIRPENSGQAWLVRLFNPSEKSEEFVYRWGGSGSAAVYESDLAGTRTRRLQLPLVVPPMGVRMIRVERQ